MLFAWDDPDGGTDYVFDGGGQMKTCTVCGENLADKIVIHVGWRHHAIEYGHFCYFCDTCWHMILQIMCALEENDG